MTNPGSTEVMTLVQRNIRGEIRRAYDSLTGWRKTAEDVIIEACQTIRHRADCGGPQMSLSRTGGARRNKSRRANRRNKRRSNRY
jgi:hypothetical protein